MTDYEEMILERQDEDAEYEDCANCPVRGEKTCDNRCMVIETIINKELMFYD